jgi:hypothetical protein
MEHDAIVALRGELGNALLCVLLGRSATSLHLYAKGQRRIPPLVAQRVECLRRIASGLAGGYNRIGTRA